MESKKGALTNCRFSIFDFFDFQLQGTLTLCGASAFQLAIEDRQSAIAASPAQLFCFNRLSRSWVKTS